VIEVLDIQQRSPEWYEARRGIPTASEFGSILAKGQGKTRRLYLTRLAAERLTGELQERYDNHHMARGREQEEDALAYYAWVNEVELQRVGFVRMLIAGGWVGCSPDALVGGDGMVEVKCRLASGMVDAMLTDGLPGEYRAQVQGGLWITGRQWCDVVLYNPDLRLLTIRVERDEDYIDTLAYEVAKFATELDAAVARFGDARAVLREQLEASL
jgi:putative phage-type endonuclease